MTKKEKEAYEKDILKNWHIDGVFYWNKLFDFIEDLEQTIPFFCGLFRPAPLGEKYEKQFEDLKAVLKKENKCSNEQREELLLFINELEKTIPNRNDRKISNETLGELYSELFKRLKQAVKDARK